MKLFGALSFKEVSPVNRPQLNSHPPAYSSPYLPLQFMLVFTHTHTPTTTQHHPHSTHTHHHTRTATHTHAHTHTHPHTHTHMAQLCLEMTVCISDSAYSV